MLSFEEKNILINPLVPDAHYSERQDKPFSLQIKWSRFKVKFSIFIFCTLGISGLNLIKFVKKLKLQIRNLLVPQLALRKFWQDLKARTQESGTLSARICSVWSGSEIFKCHLWLIL